MKRWLKITLGTLAVLALVVAGGLWWLSRPVDLQDYPEGPAPAATMERNGAVETMLLGIGIEDPLVSVQDTQAYVAYHAPDGASAADLDHLQLGVLMALAEAAPATADLAGVTAFVDGKPAVFWGCSLDALRDAGNDGAKLAAFMAGVDKQTF